MEYLIKGTIKSCKFDAIHKVTYCEIAFKDIVKHKIDGAEITYGVAIERNVTTKKAILLQVIADNKFELSHDINIVLNLFQNKNLCVFSFEEEKREIISFEVLSEK